MSPSPDQSPHDTSDSGQAPPPDETPETPTEPPTPLLQLSESLPDVVDTTEALAPVLVDLRAGTGPVAVDAERASGYRYSQRAYLLQLRRAGAPTALVDPIAFDDLAPLAEVLDGPEWILHAATQDLPCLTEIGLRPRRLFDTELAARLLNLPRVGLAWLVEDLLGARLAKEHSAVDWSTRPLPRPWLEYAALDVEALVELRGLLETRLVESGKREWADQEFEALLSFTGPPPRIDPWRRTSGMHRVRGRRALGVVRELWQARDRLAADLDVTPGRVLTDAAIVEAARQLPAGRAALRALPGMRHRQARKHLETWEDAIARAVALPDGELPPVSARTDGPPPPRAWPDRDPAAAARLAACRTVVAALSKEHQVPAENLIAPDAVRRLAWEPPTPPSVDAVAAALAATGARPWQVGLTAPGLSGALSSATE